MKLFNTLLVSGVFSDEWQQPTYEEVLNYIEWNEQALLSNDSNANLEYVPWGHPIDKFSASWVLCPELPLPEGGKKIKCDQATCALVCKKGYIAMGKRRTKCRFSLAQNFYWKNHLENCETCTDLTPPTGISQTCTTKGKKRVCKNTCSAVGDLIQLENGKTPIEVSLKCKCPRDKVTKERLCNWTSPKVGGIVTQTELDLFTCFTPTSTTTTTTTTTSEPITPLAGFDTLTDLIDDSLTHCSSADNGFQSSRSGDDDKIINGVEAKLNSWPFIVDLFLQTESQLGGAVGSQCAGTVISNNWILTAAHCCKDKVKIRAKFGQGTSSQNDPGEFTLRSTDLFIHPDYQNPDDGTGHNTDYCLAKFTEDIIGMGTDGNVRAACLPAADPVGGEACWVAGWGTTESGGISDSLLSVGINIFSKQYCLDKTQANFLTIDDICAGIPDFDGDGETDGGKDSCQGDSGGPLICPINGKATIVGVVSRGAGCANVNTAGIYSSTFQALDWIHQTVQNS